MNNSYEMDFVKKTSGSFTESHHYITKNNFYSIKLQKGKKGVEDLNEVFIKPTYVDGPSGHCIMGSERVEMRLDGIIYDLKKTPEIAEIILEARELMQYCIDNFAKLTIE